MSAMSDCSRTPDRRALYLFLYGPRALERFLFLFLFLLSFWSFGRLVILVIITDALKNKVTLSSVFSSVFVRRWRFCRLMR